MKHIGRQYVINEYLNDLNASGERLTNRFWLIAHTRWGKELVGSVSPLKDKCIYTSLDGNVFSSLDKLLVHFADTYFAEKVEETSKSIHGRRYYALFKGFNAYDKVEILETGVLLRDIPGMDEED